VPNLDYPAYFAAYEFKYGAMTYVSNALQTARARKPLICSRRKQKTALLMLMAATAVLVAVSAAHAASPRNRVVAVTRADDMPIVTVIQSAEHGNARYQTVLGYMYETGRNFPQDYHLAALWYRRAAEQGDVRAQHLLGLLYDRGQGVPLNYVEAHKWLNLAAARAASVDRDYFVRIRNAVASKLTRAEIYEAQRRAREWTLGLVR
jgi:TPR repeat protein